MPNDFQARENVGIASIKHMALWRRIGREKHNCKAELRVFYYSEWKYFLFAKGSQNFEQIWLFSGIDFFPPQRQTALLIVIIWIVAGLGQLLHHLSEKKKTQTFRNLFYVQVQGNGNYKWNFSSLSKKIVPTVSVWKQSRIGTVLPLNTGGEGGWRKPPDPSFSFCCFTVHRKIWVGNE